MSVRLSEPFVEVSQVWVDNKLGRNKTSRNRDAREYAKNRTPEQKQIKIQYAIDNMVKHCDKDEAGKEAQRQHVYKHQRKKYKANVNFRKLQSRYANATPLAGRKTRTCTLCKKLKSVYAFDINHSADNNKTTKRTYCFVCRKRMNREYYKRKKAEKAMMDG